jgi:hypothetical protein
LIIIQLDGNPQQGCHQAAGWGLGGRDWVSLMNDAVYEAPSVADSFVANSIWSTGRNPRHKCPCLEKKKHWFQHVAKQGLKCSGEDPETEKKHIAEYAE